MILLRPSSSCEPKPSSMISVCKDVPALRARSFEIATRSAKSILKASPPENNSYALIPLVSDILMSNVSFVPPFFKSRNDSKMICD